MGFFRSPPFRVLLDKLKLGLQKSFRGQKTVPTEKQKGRFDIDLAKVSKTTAEVWRVTKNQQFT